MIRSREQFRMKEIRDGNGGCCLALIGELDLAVADQFSARLRDLAGDGVVVRLDLAGLEFIDSSGIRELLAAISAARRDGRRLEIGSDLTSQVRRLFELVGAGPYVWPECAAHRADGRSVS